MSYMTVMPHPIIEESLAGFLIRLIKLNGFKEIQEIMTMKQFGYLCQGKGPLFNKIVHEYELEDVLKSFITKQTASIISVCKICPQCMLENEPVLQSWQSNQAYHCVKHNVVLVDTCPGCQQRLSWDLPILEAKCTNDDCGALLSSRKSQLTSLPDEKLSDCVIAAKWFQKVAGISETMASAETIELGYQFLTSDEHFKPIIKQYLEQTEQLQMYPISLRYFKALTLIEQFQNDWPVMAEFADKIGCHLVQEPTLSCTKVPELFIPRKVLLAYMGGLLKCSGLMSLISKYCKKRKSSDEISSEPEFSLDLLMTTLISNAHVDNEKSYSLRSWSSIISSYGVKAIDVVHACCDAKVNFHFKPQLMFLDAIMISEQHMRNFVIQHWERKKVCYLDSVLASTICQLTDREMAAARSEGLLKTYIISKSLPASYKKRDVLNLSKLLDPQLPLPIAELSESTYFQNKYVPQTIEGRPPT